MAMAYSSTNRFKSNLLTNIGGVPWRKWEQDHAKKVFVFCCFFSNAENAIQKNTAVAFISSEIIDLKNIRFFWK